MFNPEKVAKEQIRRSFQQEMEDLLGTKPIDRLSEKPTEKADKPKNLFKQRLTAEEREKISELNGFVDEIAQVGQTNSDDLMRKTETMLEASSIYRQADTEEMNQINALLFKAGLEKEALDEEYRAKFMQEKL